VGRGFPLFADQDEKDRLEARNARLQFRRILELVPCSRGESKDRGHFLRLTPETIKALHLSLLQGVYSCAGTFRTWRVGIRSSPHSPPDDEFVPDLVEEMCERANGGTGDDWDPVQTAAYVLWRLNWIHPFGGGNGRTSRAVAYLALCVRLGFVPPGSRTLGELIDEDRSQYIRALRDADAAWLVGVTDIRMMTEYLTNLLEKQFGAAMDGAPEG
jgi:Fic family protein